jgi:3',5'-cyclic-nucleotide phosphodiesterase
LIEIAELDNHDLVAMIIAGVCHDFGHDGYNNAYHVNANTMRSIRYTDSVQENYHAAESFQLLMKPDNNFLEALSREDV